MNQKPFRLKGSPMLLEPPELNCHAMSREATDVVFSKSIPPDV